MFKARAGSLEVNGRTHRWNGIGESCQNCNGGVKETIEHLLVECDNYERERRAMMIEMQRILGQEGWQSVHEREDEGMSIILGFQCGEGVIDDKMGEIVETTKAFLKASWKRRGS